jgi:peptide/nickel transport system substrate-binding protein
VGSTAPEQPRARKLLTIGVNREPSTIHGFASGGSNTSRGNTEVNFLHSLLVVENADDTFVPQLVQETPTIANGLWQLNPDGTMDLTWKLRNGVKWHDGTPFTAEDVLFAFRVYKDPDFPHPYLQQMRLMASAVAPDPSIVVVHWTRIDTEAGQARGLSPLPRHLLEELYTADKDAFLASPRFGDQYVGLGPYRMVRWERGSYMELARFDDYFGGPPPLDAVVIRYIPDPNTMVANILSGAVDVLLPPSVDLDGVQEVQRRWQGTGNVVRVGPIPWFLYMTIQYRPEMAKPSRGLADANVRRALYLATNRQALTDVMTHGSGLVADSWLRPGTPERMAVESAIPQYAFDPGQAGRLLADAGWRRGSDGILVHAETGERFSSELWSNTRVVAQGDKQLAIISQDWKAIGAEMSVYTIPSSLSNDREHESRFPTATLTTTPNSGYLRRLDSRQISSPANDWSGRNVAGYASSSLDGLLDRLAVTIDERERGAIGRSLAQEIGGSLVTLPLYWQVDPVLALEAVKADINPNNPAWNAWTWDKR